MADHPRRRFLKASVGVVSGLALPACSETGQTENPAATGFDRPMLDALAAIVLPIGALGAQGAGRAVDGFLAWLDGFEPVTERDHPYDAGDITYGPPDPAPLWRAQLEALDLEAEQRFGARWHVLDANRQLGILRHQLPDQVPAEMPYAGAATHVALGLVAWFYATPLATDLALEAAVGRYTCRGLAGGADKPRPSGS